MKTDLVKALNLGSTPAANAFLRESELSAPEPSFPLELYLCTNCALLQMIHVLSPEVLFRDYVYVSSTSPHFVAHFERSCDDLCRRLSLPDDALIVDIGSNDGILLRPYAAKGMRVLGVDPATHIAQLATESGIPTVPEFFCPDLAARIKAEQGAAHLVTATNVFPHVSDLSSLVDGVRTLLRPEGVFVTEVYYLADLIHRNQFDTIYHEHLSYFSGKTIERTLREFGMEVIDITRISTHGGSLRVLAQRTSGPRPVLPSVASLLQAESALGLEDVVTYRQFAQRIDQNKRRLTEMLHSLKKEGASIAGYGAPAKSTTLLHYFDIGLDVLDFIVDDSPWKQGLYTPGKHIPVTDAGELDRCPPDYLLILAWNFATPIMRKCATFSERGGRFVLPMPHPQVL